MHNRQEQYFFLLCCVSRSVIVLLMNTTNTSLKTWSRNGKTVEIVKLVLFVGWLVGLVVTVSQL